MNECGGVIATGAVMMGAGACEDYAQAYRADHGRHWRHAIRRRLFAFFRHEHRRGGSGGSEYPIATMCLASFVDRVSLPDRLQASAYGPIPTHTSLPSCSRPSRTTSRRPHTWAVLGTAQSGELCESQAPTSMTLQAPLILRVTLAHVTRFPRDV